jgi:hypothetical protein
VAGELEDAPLATTAANIGAQAATLPERAATFLGAIGVNIHLGFVGETAPIIISDMAYLGLSNIRSHGIGPLSSPAQVEAFGDLAAAGLKFDWLTGSTLSTTLSDLNTFLKAHPNAISTIEGPNEVNNFPIAFGALSGNSAALAYQSALYSAVKSNPLSASIPVLDFTDSPGIVGAADAANDHPYPKAGAQPLASLTDTAQRLQKLMPGAPEYFTEAGYSSLPGLHGWEGVDAATQAKLTLNLIMDAASLGIKATYLYDLIDDGPDLSNTIGTDHFGLFTIAGKAKPAAVAIHNLTAILSDPGAAATSFTQTALNYTISGLPTSGSSFLIEKSAGVYDLVLWAEAQIWNAATHSPVPAPTEQVVVDFASAAGQASVFDPLVSASALTTETNAKTVTVAVSDHPVILQVSNFAQAMSSFGAAKAAIAWIHPPVAPTPSAAPTLVHGHGA